MVDEQRPRAAHRRHPGGPLVAAGVTVTLLFLILGGCVGAGSPSGGGGPVASPPPGSAILPPAPSAVATPVATPAVTTVPIRTPIPSAGQPAAAPLVVTAADNGTTLHLAVGQQLLLDLGSAVDWAVTVADQRVVGRVIGVLVIRGAQGIYEARTAGTTLLSAIGSPPCPSGGACPLFRLGFRLTIVVG
jgi:hypothetical protein